MKESVSTTKPFHTFVVHSKPVINKTGLLKVEIRL